MGSNYFRKQSGLAAGNVTKASRSDADAPSGGPSSINTSEFRTGRYRTLFLSFSIDISSSVLTRTRQTVSFYPKSLHRPRQLPPPMAFFSKIVNRSRPCRPDSCPCPSYGTPPSIMVIDRDTPSTPEEFILTRPRSKSAAADLTVTPRRSLRSCTYKRLSSSLEQSMDSEDSLSSTGGDAPRSQPSSSDEGSRRERSRRSRSLEDLPPNAKLWAALRRGKFDKVYDILLEEWRKRLSTASTDGDSCLEFEREHSACASRPTAGLDVNTPNTEGVTALHLCAFAGNPRCVRLLLALGANPSAGDNDSWTPLHAAAVKGFGHLIVMLACTGASLRAEDRQGRTPYDAASSNPDTQRLLKKLQKLDKRKSLLTTNQSLERLTR